MRELVDATERQKGGRAAIVRLLRRVVSLLEGANVTYLMSDGTLLGAFRHHAIIPWDDDVEYVTSIILL